MEVRLPGLVSGDEDARHHRTRPALGPFDSVSLAWCSFFRRWSCRSPTSVSGLLVQRKTITATDCSTVFWASAVLGALFTLIGLMLAPLVARFYHEPQVTALFSVLALSFVVSGFGATQRSLLFRAMDFRSLELRLMVAGFVGAGIGIALAAAGAGPWALVGMAVAEGIVSTLLLWIFSPWRPRAAFSFESLRSFGPFGGRFAGAGVFTALSQNVDNVLVGRYLGPTSLGLYTLAYSVILVPLADRETAPAGFLYRFLAASG